MPRFLRYEDALAWAHGQARLTVEGMARALDVSPDAARHVLDRMAAEGIVGPAGPDGAQVVLGQRRRRWDTMAAAPAAEPATELARLRSEASAALRRAEAAEARLAAQAAPRERIALLRRLLARELHPDTAAPAADPALQAACAEVFKRVWPRIERVLDGEAAEETG